MENLNNFILAAINKITYFNFISNKNLVEALENIMRFLVLIQLSFPLLMSVLDLSEFCVFINI